jgi:hypothetical protein
MAFAKTEYKLTVLGSGGVGKTGMPSFIFVWVIASSSSLNSE